MSHTLLLCIFCVAPECRISWKEVSRIRYTDLLNHGFTTDHRGFHGGIKVALWGHAVFIMMLS